MFMSDYATEVCKCPHFLRKIQSLAVCQETDRRYENSC